MSNFIFSVEGIFTTCLAENKVKGYYIGPYQRGYKWKSKAVHDQVPVLLSDLFEAFLKRKTIYNTEYYLQYITVKRTALTKGSYFEVIDGQQRLTTLTLLFNVLEKYFNQANPVKNDDGHLLYYARYEEDQDKVFTEILDFGTGYDIEQVEEQDKYYMYLASKSIKDFFDILNKDNNNTFQSFVQFIRGDVKIILNKENEITAPEEVFSNLNANKVPLTNAYLIKSLLLTKASRSSGISHVKKNFKEIIDERTIMARTWDDISNWFSQPEIAKYFFGDVTDGMERMLDLIEFETDPNSSNIIKAYRSKLEQADNIQSDNYQLFNRFHEQILTAEDARNYLIKIKHIYKRLKSWYEENNMYNLLGYYLNRHGGIRKLITFDNKEVVKELKTDVKKSLVIPKFNSKNLQFSELSYDKNLEYIRQLLLSFSVFPENIDRNTNHDYRFNFYAYANQEWSLEHIFPQNPNESTSDYLDDKEWMISMANRKGHTGLAARMLNNERLEKGELYIVYDVFNNLDGLGNMALLSRKENSALRNGFFNAKRKILLKHINKGSFVPRHTLDIFSKMLDAKADENGLVKFDENLRTWSNEDAAAHLSWIINRVQSLTKEFST